MVALTLLAFAGGTVFFMVMTMRCLASDKGRGASFGCYVCGLLFMLISVVSFGVDRQYRAMGHVARDSGATQLEVGAVYEVVGKVNFFGEHMVHIVRKVPGGPLLAYQLQTVNPPKVFVRLSEGQARKSALDGKTYQDALVGGGTYGDSKQFGDYLYAPAITETR